MNKIGNILALLAITAWVGGMWGVGFLAVPVLFTTLPDKMLAGMLAGKMFTLIAWLGIACACYLLLHQFASAGNKAMKSVFFWVVSAMFLITLVSQFGIHPVMESLKTQAYPADIMQSEFAGRFDTLHHIASSLYVVQSLLGIVLVAGARRVGRN